jgi:hypothetical protein
MEWAIHFDSIGFLREAKFPPTLRYKLPNIVYSLVLMMLSSQLNILI